MTTLALRHREPEQERISVALQASLAAAAEARATMAGLSELSRLPDLAFIAQLLTSELVSNALRHAGLRAGETFVLTAECDQESLHVEVADPGRGADALSLLRAHLLRDVHHGGLSLLNALADRWGFRRGVGGFVVWYELDLVPGRRAWRGRMPLTRS